MSRVATIFLLRDDGAALLQHRDDKPGLRRAGVWVPPGGHCEPGESFEACARREFLEETDYVCGDLHPLGTVLDDPADGSPPDELAVFWAAYDGTSPFRCLEGQDLRFVGRGPASGIPFPANLMAVWDRAVEARAARVELLGREPEKEKPVAQQTASPAGAARQSGDFDAAAERARCLRLRRRILDMSQTVSALHIAGAFSCLEIVDTIYFGLMRHADEAERPDTFILSKGHGSLSQYTVLEELGVLPRAELDRYCKPGGILGTHPDYGTPGIEASTGSLGHGLGLGVGMALADKIYGHDRVVYVVMSDGELQEGSVWEIMLLAPTLGITNVVAVVDLNDFQSLGRTSEIHPNFYPVAEKIRAFGWESAEVDGHDPQAVYDAIRSRSGAKPLMVVARTTKGKGVSYMESVPIWHYRSPSPAEYRQALDELERAGV